MPLTGDVATDYVQIRTLEARLQIARNNVEVQREALNIAEIRFKGGTTTERDVEQARTVLASTEATSPQLESALGQTKNVLSVLLGMSPNPLGELLAGSKAAQSLSLTLVRMLSVAINLIGAGLDRTAVAFIGWSGPRTIAPVLYLALVVERFGFQESSRSSC